MKNKIGLSLVVMVVAAGCYVSIPLAEAAPTAREVFQIEADGFSRVKKTLEAQYEKLGKLDPKSLQVSIQRGNETFPLSASELKTQLKVGDRAFVPAAWVHPLQTVISYYGVGINVFLKAKKKLEYPQLAFDEQRSTHDLSSAKDAVLGPDGEIYLLDGHHTFMASLLAGSTTFPIKIKDHFQAQGSGAHQEEQFIDYLIGKKSGEESKKEQAYLIDLMSGEVATRLKRSFLDLDDSHLRGWVDAAGAEIPEVGESETKRVIRAEISQPAWIRDGNTQPSFAEFKVARILVDLGLGKACPECLMPADRLSPHVNEMIRKHMLIAKERGLLNFPGVYVLPEPKKLEELNLNEIITEAPENTEYKIDDYSDCLPLNK